MDGEGRVNRTLFSNVQIFDGSGANPFPGEVLIEGRHIAAVVAAGEELIAATRR
jgi:N-acyl-D-aspartate/D-glutamate deacylase